MITSDKVGFAAASTAVTSPVWLAWLEDTAHFASTVLPILGVAWMVLQIIGKLHQWARFKRKDDEK